MLAQGVDDARRVVHGQGGLGHVGELLRVAHRQSRGLGFVFHQINRAAGAVVVLAHGSLHLRVPGVTDQHALAALGAVAGHFHVHLGDQRTGRIEDFQTALIRLLAHRPGNAVGREDHNAPVGHLVQLFDKHRAARAQIVDDKAVVNHLVAHVDRRAEDLQGAIHDRDSAIHPGAKAPGVGQLNLHHSAASTRCIWTSNRIVRPARG